MAATPNRAQSTIISNNRPTTSAPTTTHTSLDTITTPQQPTTGRFLYVLIFVCGISTLGMEMGASRLLSPYFGNTLSLWGVLISATMIFMTVGYSVGGRLADRVPTERVLFGLMVVASVLIGLIGVISKPVLDFAFTVTKGENGMYVGAIIAILLMYALPIIILTTISPFAFRLRSKNQTSAGKTAGLISTLATTGSIVGTLVPVFVVMPTFGNRANFYIFAVLLLVMSLVGFGLLALQKPTSAHSDISRRDTSPTIGTKVAPRVAAPTNGQAGNGAFLLVVVFVGGITSLAMEMGASALLNPYFGSSTPIWAILISLVLIYLSIGYSLGGWLADRMPDARVLYTLTGVAALWISLIPVASNPVLGIGYSGFQTGDGGQFFGSLFGIIALFSVPMVLISCVSPFAVRLLVRNIENAGKTAGTVSTVSTAGSVLGALIPSFIVIPLIGVRPNFYIFGVLLLGLSAVGLYLNRSRSLSPAFGLALVGIVALAIVTSGWAIKPPPAGTKLLAEKQSAYNYIQVVQAPVTVDGKPHTQNRLVLNEGHATHSIYDPDAILTGGPWDYFMAAPFFNKQQRETDVKQALIIGLGAGTTPQQMVKGYGEQVHIDGVEIDPEIIRMGQRYFNMNEPNLNAIEGDGRYYLRASSKTWDVIGIDAYKQPYIPFYLTTKEFFQEVRDHLTPNGVAVINGGRVFINGKNDYRLPYQLARTLKNVYPNVFIIDVPGYLNSIIVATNQPTTIENFRQNITQYVTNDLIKQVGTTAIQQGNLREWTDSSNPYTDDWAPVEQLIDGLIIDYVSNGGK